jgi:hypothetical protein
MFCYYIISLRRIFIFYTHNNSQIILHHSVYEISHIQKIVYDPVMFGDLCYIVSL